MAHAEGVAAACPKLLEVAFLFDAEAYTFGDVVAAGVLCGEWAALAARAQRRQWYASDPSPDLDERAAEEIAGFRRAHRLQAASDLREWLSERGLEAEDLVRYARAVAAEKARPAGEPDGPAGNGHAGGCDWWPEAVLDGDIARWVMILQRWVTASHIRDAAAAPAQDGSAAGGAEEQRAGRLARIRADYRAWEASAVDDPAIDRLIRRKRMDWTWLDYDALFFRSESAAWEAALCVREDGERLDDVVARAGPAVVPRSGRREDLPPAEGSVLMAVAPGEVGGPVVAEDGPMLLRLRQAAAPATSDGALRRRARAEILDVMLAKASAGRIRQAGKW